MFVRIILLCGLALTGTFAAERGSLDREFSKVPFDDWFTGGGQVAMKWKVRVSPPELSVHQRLWTHVELQLDGREVAARRGKGELVFFVQFTDSANQRYQNHFAIDLAKMEEGIRAQDLLCSMFVFVLPGDYRIALAVYDSATGEHSVKVEKLHVAPLKNDPLPDIWRDLPSAEFVSDLESPASWFLPSQRGRVRLDVAPPDPVDISVIVNGTPSERATASARAQNRNLGVLIPALKIVSEIEVRGASRNIELLDLTRQRVTFHQNGTRDIDWPSLSRALTQADSGVIDVKSLGARQDSAAFFVREVSWRIDAAEPAPHRVLIVLSGPVAFERGENLQPIETKSSTATRVFYIRYRAPVVRPINLENGRPREMGRMRGPGGAFPQRLGPGPLIDELEPTLKPLAPRLFDVETPEQFRKALAAILAEISAL